MAEVTMVRESRVRSINAQGRARTSRVPQSDRGFYDDSFATVYDAGGKVVEQGLWDDSSYRDESPTWNAKDGNYDLKRGYKIVLKN